MCSFGGVSKGFERTLGLAQKASNTWGLHRGPQFVFIFLFFFLLANLELQGNLCLNHRHLRVRTAGINLKIEPQLVFFSGKANLAALKPRQEAQRRTEGHES